ncbi:CapA family protein [Niabella hibiscisoli]|uniref:CapA family protein n=1 Tax=Niabella hibiscisoli TaxID=1825928 RepID=UPI0021D41FF8|nr:CapA family protein [Niabella hibiscisoli]
MAHHCIDEGADLVIGSGPHVTRGMEIYKNKLIAYSLGNFATYGNMSLHGPMGYAPLLKIYLNKKETS